MFIKLQYTVAKTPATFFRVLNEIINDATLTSISAVQTKSGTASWHSSLTTNFDWTNSYVIRTGTGATALTSNTASHIARPSLAAGSDPFEFVLKQKVYDASTLYYTSITCPSIAGTVTSTVGNGLTNVFSSSGWDVTTDTNQAVAAGTLLTVTGVPGAISHSQITASVTGFTMWVHVTDNSFTYAFNPSVNGYSVMGYPSLANLAVATNWYGPYQYSQYTRRDYWNTDALGIIPLAYTNPNRAFGSFGNIVSDWTTAKNSISLTTTENPYSIFNYAEVIPTNTTVWAKAAYSQVVWGVGNRYSDYPMNTISNSTTAGVATYGSYISTSAQYRVLLPSLDGKRGYALLPLTFKRNGMLGGNITDKAGYYLFNGDYFPGDEFTYGGKTYHIMPGNVFCQANRLGWAIPKE